MSYKALYRTYRPSCFEDVVGQKHIVATLQNAVKQNKIAHAYLFCGPRGTGKTSIAKLLAKAVNCTDSENAPCGVCPSCLSVQKGNHPDIIEIDAASNNGVDEIRDLIEKVKYSPIEGKYKVYIIDEVHMLSTGAFNALLKTLEEPPAHVIFVLATTEPHKVLPTIISRCQRYDFTKVENNEIIKRINIILNEENIQCEEEAIRLIAVLADGGMRDALSILDQCIAYAQNNITCKDVNDIYGITTVKDKLSVLNSIFNKDAKEVLNQIKTWADKGIDIRRLTSDLIDTIKECVIYKYTSDVTLLSKLAKEEAEQINSRCKPIKLLELIQVLVDTTEKYKNAASVTSYFEVAILKMIALIDDSTPKMETMNKDLTKEPFKQESIPTQPKTELKQEIEADAQLSKSEEVIVDTEDNQMIVQSLDQIEENFEPLIIDENVELVVQEVVIEEKKSDSILDDDYILGLMVQGNKMTKLEDIEKWASIIDKCKDMKWARLANILRLTSVAVSNDLFMLLQTEDQAVVNQVCEEKDEMEEFISNELSINKRLFIITTQEFADLTKKFVERKNNNNLPRPVEIKAKKIEDKIETKKKDENYTQMINLFGEDFDVIEEDK